MTENFIYDHGRWLDMVFWRYPNSILEDFIDHGIMTLAMDWTNGNPVCAGIYYSAIPENSWVAEIGQ